MNYYRRYIGDYQRKTMRLDPTDHGVYDLMLDYCYAEESPLPLEMDDIYAICKAIKAEHRKSVAKVLRLYFERREDGYHNTRADEEIAISKQARDNGKGGGRPRKSKTETITGSETGCETQTITGSETGSETGWLTGEVTGSGHPPTTNLQPLTFTPQPPTSKPPTKGNSNVIAGGKSVARGSRLAPDWQLPADWLAWATTEQPTWDRAHAERVASIFRDYWTAQPGQKGVKLDWEATWRNWVRKEGPVKGNGAGNAEAVKEAARRRIFGTDERDITHEAERL